MSTGLPRIRGDRPRVRVYPHQQAMATPHTRGSTQAGAAVNDDRKAALRQVSCTGQSTSAGSRLAAEEDTMEMSVNLTWQCHHVGELASSIVTAPASIHVGVAQEPQVTRSWVYRCRLGANSGQLKQTRLS